MAGNVSRSDQLWRFALRLAEEETKAIPFAQQEGNFMSKHRFILQI